MNVPEPHGDSSVPQSTGMPAKDDASDTANNRTVINAFKQKAEFSSLRRIVKQLLFFGRRLFPAAGGGAPEQSAPEIVAGVFRRYRSPCSYRRFLKNILNLQSEFLEASLPLNVMATEPSESFEEHSAPSASALSNSYSSGSDTATSIGKSRTRDILPSREFSAEFQFADLNSNPVWATCLSVPRICGFAEAGRRIATLTPRAGTRTDSGSLILPIGFFVQNS